MATKAKPKRLAPLSGNEAKNYHRDILAHKRLVSRYMTTVITDLTERSALHDYSKFSGDEFDSYAHALPRFSQVTFGTPEYAALLAEIEPALKHHYASNRHHPEYFSEGIEGMTLIDLVEMVCDWIAAAQRKPGGVPNLTVCQERFGISPQLMAIIRNTVEALLPPETGK